MALSLLDSHSLCIHSHIKQAIGQTQCEKGPDGYPPQCQAKHAWTQLKLLLDSRNTWNPVAEDEAVDEKHHGDGKTSRSKGWTKLGKKRTVSLRTSSCHSTVP